MTTPDPRTDLAGYLGLTDDQAEDCRRSAPFHPGSVHTKIGARLIEQDQARDAEPDDGLIPVTNEQIEVFRAAWLKADDEGRSGQRVRAGLEAVFALELPAPTPPWKSPLDDLPDLTEEQCWDAYDATLADPDMPYLKGVIGRALIAAGWTPRGGRMSSTVAVDPVVVSCAVRYALGRSSYMPGLICDVVRAIWADLGDQREVIRESVERHLNERAMLLRRKPFDSVADQPWVDLLFWIQEADRD